MNIYALIPLVAVIAYIPLFVILISHRPWQGQHKLFAAYLSAAVFWSFADIFFRSDLFVNYKTVLLKIVVCAFMLNAVQYHCFISSFYPKGKRRWLPFAYASLAVVIVTVALGRITAEVAIANGMFYPEYTIGVLLLGLPLTILTARSVYFLRKRFVSSDDPVLRNHVAYLLLSISVLTLFVLITLLPQGREFPIAHIGNLINAGILSYVTVKHRLLDMRVVMRRGIVYSIMAGVFTAVYALWLSLIHFVFKLDYNFSSLLLVGFLTIVSAAIFWAQLRVYIYRKVDEMFYGERYGYREDLVELLQHKGPVFSNLGEFAKGLITPITEALGCCQARLLFPDADTNDFVALIAQPEKTGDLPLRIRQDSPVLEWLKREDRYLSKENIEMLPEFSNIQAEERIWLKDLEIELLFPLVSRGNLIAILALGKKESGKYSVEDADLVEAVTTQVAASLEKEFLQERLRKQEQEYLQEQLRKREQELALINRLATVITSSLNIRDVYGAFIAELKEVVSIDWATIAVIEGDEIRLEVLSTDVGSAWEVGEKMPLKGTGTEWVANHKKALVELDLAKNRKFRTGEDHFKRGIRSIVYLPLLVKNEAIGSLIIASRQPNAYTPGQLQVLERLASQIAMPVENSRLYAKAEQRARVDEITGLFNRRYFNECMREEIERHTRYSGILSLILLDLDFFKAYNDAHGHMAGDKILELIGRLVNGAIRNTDLAFRYGGDEFAIILPQSATNDALIVAERVRERIAAEMNKKNINLTASLGLASWPSDGVTPDELVNVADRALYHSKEMGGNRTIVVSKMVSAESEKTGTTSRAKKRF